MYLTFTEMHYLPHIILIYFTQRFIFFTFQVQPSHLEIMDQTDLEGALPFI